MIAIPDDVQEKIGVPLWASHSGCVVNDTSIKSYCAAARNGSTLFWRDTSGAPRESAPAPAAMVSVWGRPDMWRPDADEPQWALQSHFYLKRELGLQDAVIVDSELEIAKPLRIGDLVDSVEIIRSISELKTTRLGTGRFWDIDVVYRNQSGEHVGTETYRAFGYQK
ncbi:MaoC family dehydratase [Pseudomaricurvus alkylphenolicus]|jgi:hypothetical protein|uniref:FAS1-like dehydratase domain-containing protein n=1 Tax=Pseudomaricurvus alkylphenolicus TaxID=1306991 RepID=UPI00141EA23D|nr:MaoC family dehydratase N-terminal domain-containing protein [Pseudomaricurvus alkylphenolicus]NIB42150.1 MaoC family dehydratase [Pseudomaricurvus alkylphenolicus]